MAFPIDLHSAYEEAKWWGPLLGAFWAIFKAFSWVKDIRRRDLTDIKGAVTVLQTGLKEQTDAFKEGLDKQTDVLKEGLSLQTSTFVSELKEMRQDIRTFYAGAAAGHSAAVASFNSQPTMPGLALAAKATGKGGSSSRKPRKKAA